MTAWRHDPLTGRSVCFAPRRDERPNDFAGGPARGCPFCAGAESQTPAEVDRLADGSRGWLARVVPNLYPIVEGDDGVHEVVIESPRHVKRFVDLTNEEASAAIQIVGRRLAELRGAGGHGYRLWFKNEGRLAGASLEHAHSQLVALPEAPPQVAAMARRLAEDHGWPPATRIVAEGGWELLAPHAPRVAHETWIAPAEEGVPLSDLADPVVATGLSRVLRRALAAISCEAFNLVLQAPPAGVPEPLADRWWIEIVPRDASVAGFELATGAWINPVSAEAARRRFVERLAAAAANPEGQASGGAAATPAGPPA